MSARISIVIPTLNAAGSLPRCLETLIEGLIDGLICELVITDGGSEDATLEIADEVGARIVRGVASRGGQLRRGVADTRGDWVLILHADTVLAPGWSRLVRQHVEFDTRPAYFHLAFDISGLWPAMVSRWANLRARVFALPYGDQGLLIRRSDYDAAGGFPDQPLMEDVALALRLGRTLVGMPVTARTSAARYARDGWLSRGTRNLWTLARYLGGADPTKLAASYRKQLGRTLSVQPNKR
ncbi:MAG: TIGR04283 family arsenosugar biosynthesis glycosyltransferase [Pseudomonadota bacterium]